MTVGDNTWIAMDLTTISTAIWQQLQLGAQPQRHPFHTVVLATIDAQFAPQVRTVVLRQVDPAQAMITCYTDSRAEKVGQLQQQQQVAWLVYDPAAQVQVRLVGQAQLHYQDEVATAAWEQLPWRSQKFYCSLPPGMARPQPDSGLLNPPPSANCETLAMGKSNFAVIRSFITAMDWLKLGVNGHYRARFERVANNWQGQWITP